jgi:hypothetical protein
MVRKSQKFVKGIEEGRNKVLEELYKKFCLLKQKGLRKEFRPYVEKRIGSELVEQILSEAKDERNKQAKEELKNQYGIKINNSMHYTTTTTNTKQNHNSSSIEQSVSHLHEQSTVSHKCRLRKYKVCGQVKKSMSPEQIQNRRQNYGKWFLPPSQFIRKIYS